MATRKTLQLERELVGILEEKGKHLHGFHDLEPLIERLGKSRLVLLGEASHGTHEYYSWRSYITRRLVAEYGFQFVAVEGDWPDCYAVNRFIKHKKDTAANAMETLQQFDRWPTWMWANWEMVALTEWLHRFNQDLPQEKKVGFYGLDVYSLWDSLVAVREYLQENDPGALEQADKAFRCFSPYKEDETAYAYAARMVPAPCEDAVIKLLGAIRSKVRQYDSDEEDVFSTEQNALIAVNAEKYYRAMIAGGADSWNVRDGHMAETLDRLLHFHGPKSKAIIWEHNTHIGDSRATTMVDEGMYNIGELVRTAYNPEEIMLVGFGSYAGTVIAGSSWGAPHRVIDVPEAREGSWENLLHQAGGNRLLFSEDLKGTPFEEQPFGHRAIGVVYRPQYERYGNYVPSVIPRRYDAFIFLDQTRALHPLHGEPHQNKIPDTYPFGM